MALFEWFYKVLNKDNPIYKPIYDENVPFLERVSTVEISKKAARQDKVRALKEKHGPDYVYLHPISRFVLYKEIWKDKLRVSLMGRGYLAFRCRWWTFRLWTSKFIQSVWYLSPTRRLRVKYLRIAAFGAFLGILFANTNDVMTSPLMLQFTYRPRVHWMASYLMDTSMLKDPDEDMKKDNLAQGMERVMTEGIELGKLDSLSWLMLGTYFSVKREDEFAYLSFHMAHLVEHQKIGGNSLQPLDIEDANKLFRQN